MECRPFKDQSYDKALAEQEIGIQSVPSLKNEAAQTIQLALSYIFTIKRAAIFKKLNITHFGIVNECFRLIMTTMANYCFCNVTNKETK